jgi:hypothetical protein
MRRREPIAGLGTAVKVVMNLAGAISCEHPQEHLADAGMLYVPGGTFHMDRIGTIPKKRQPIG